MYPRIANSYVVARRFHDNPECIVVGCFDLNSWGSGNSGIVQTRGVLTKCDITIGAYVKPVVDDPLKGYPEGRVDSIGSGMSVTDIQEQRGRIVIVVRTEPTGELTRANHNHPHEDS